MTQRPLAGQTILVTGAGGFLGRNIAAALLAAGADLYAIDRHFDKFVAPSLQTITADCRQMPPLRAQALVHAAFITDALDTPPESQLRANNETLSATLAYAQKQAIARVICLSSDALFQATSAMPISPDRPPNPQGAYGVAKAQMEATAATLRESGRDVLCARLGAIYGPHETMRPTRPRLSLVARLLHQASTSGEIALPRPQESREWTYAPDIGRALVALLAAEKLNHPLYQLASGDVLNNLELALRIQQALPGTSLRILADSEHSEPPVTRRGWLETARLRDDTGFCSWRRMDSATLRASL
ncbi:MAG: NAD(P)-dependent oxidoreductase [Chloroflexi bacterium]|nr:NAD(P)-dependent oxidoreductase [Chloroflexota bacterium]